MERKSRQQETISFRELPFSELIQRDRHLAELRREYAHGPAEERRKAAEWAYDESIASRLFNQSLALEGQESPVQEPWPEGIAALAIDPTYAPAMLTVGSMEYQLGRRDEATALFHGLLKLPADTPELEVIIDKAGDYFLSEKDYERAADLYAAASATGKGRLILRRPAMTLPETIWRTRAVASGWLVALTRRKHARHTRGQSSRRTRRKRLGLNSR